MKTLNLSRLIDNLQLDKDQLAVDLFPTHKHPARALNRVLIGESTLDTPQLLKLAAITDLTFEQLFNEVQYKTKAKKGLITFETEDFRAELNTTEWTTKVFHKGTLFHEEMLHKQGIQLSEYLNTITNIIKTFKK